MTITEDTKDTTMTNIRPRKTRKEIKTRKDSQASRSGPIRAKPTWRKLSLPFSFTPNNQLFLPPSSLSSVSLTMLSSVTLHPSPPPSPQLQPSLNHSLSSPFQHTVLLPSHTPSPSPLSLRRPNTVRTHYLDAVQPYDYEAKIEAQYHASNSLKIAIFGFGNYGQFLAKTLTRQGHTVIAHSRTDYTDTARKLGVSFFIDPHDLCEEHPDVVLLCTSIISTEQVLKSLPFQRLRRSTLFVDVLSVKEFAKSLLTKFLPEYFDIICTHPMFGPESGKSGWNNLFFVYEKVRIGNEAPRISRAEKFLDIFSREGCQMVEMSCAEHDEYAAESQFITHTVGRLLDMLNLESTPINTKGYEALLDLVENTSGDSFDLYYGLFLYNKKALEMLENLDLAFEKLRKELFGRLHAVVREELFEGIEMPPNANETNGMLNHSHNSAALATISDPFRFKDFVQVSNSNGNSSNCIDCSLKIAIVGFGNFGQFLAKTIVRQGHTVLAYSRTDYSAVAESLGVTFFSDADDLCEEHPEVILLCTSILSTERVLNSLPLQRLKRSTLFVDVLSVKEFPRSLFLQNLPPDFDILCTHPMFGPESGKNGWNGLSFVYDKVRVGSDELRQWRCNQFLDIFVREGCRMVEMTCAEHDWHAAGSQFITHTVGRVLEKLGLETTPINTRGYETLLKLVENTAGDSFDLYYGLFMYNANAMEQLERLDYAFESLRKQLFGGLHGVLRRQLFGYAEKVKVLQ